MSVCDVAASLVLLGDIGGLQPPWGQSTVAKNEHQTGCCTILMNNSIGFAWLCQLNVLQCTEQWL